MDDDPAARIMATIRAFAGAEGKPASVRHVCQACAMTVHADAAGLYLIGDLGLGEPVYATDLATERIMDLQATIGEGPAVQALDELCPVLAPTLAGVPSMRRWPVFAPSAVEAGARAVFAFPLVEDDISVGVLEVYRPVEDQLSGAEIADALMFADAAMALLVAQARALPTAEEEAEEFSDGLGARWGEIHLAVGVVSVQLRSNLSEAFLRLRARAFASGRPLSEIAEDVLMQRIQFTR
jgi:GAF domain-containing protein